MIAGSLLLIVLLIIAPRNSSSQKAVEEAVFEGDIDLFEGIALPIKNRLQAWEKFSGKPEYSVYLDSMVSFSEANRLPFQAAWYHRKIAELKNTDSSWYENGMRFEKAYAFLLHQSHRQKAFEMATVSFEKALTLNPNMVRAKIKLGSLLLEGGEPMKGIGMLREIAEKYPDNIEVQLALGFASVKSAQYDKALTRFANVLSIDSAYYDAWVYLANTYEMMGDTVNAIKHYTIYEIKNEDTLVKREVKKYIKKFKK